ncbi:MAG: NAD(+)/NADH kinase [Oscillospiraceae bacterium]|nr:NAD(+)/NADH kinase [Oscillospiraceae bacterium]
MKKVVLCPNASRDVRFATSREVGRILEDIGILSVLCPLPDCDDGRGSGGGGYAELAARLADAEMIIAFGGDGTILRTARAAAGYGVPVLGVNLGGKGFMAELERDGVGAIPGALTGGYDVESRMMLDVELRRGDAVICEDFALNDVVIGGMTKIVDITLCGDGNVISELSGDGVVIATPTGSTAYSLSAGGPIVEPSARNILITPVCAHMLKARPFVLASERLVSVRLGSARQNPAYMSVDGCDYVELIADDLINVRESPKKTLFARLSGGSFYRKVSEKLGEPMK